MTNEPGQSTLALIGVALTALFREPLAVGMAVVAVVFIVRALILNRAWERLLSVVLAIVSGGVSWMMASHWRWPGS